MTNLLAFDLQHANQMNSFMNKNATHHAQLVLIQMEEPAEEPVEFHCYFSNNFVTLHAQQTSKPTMLALEYAHLE